ncbi:retrovirus-related pol polyprotein from transposon TNT 1-94 [Tanacetum coccineum]
MDRNDVRPIKVSINTKFLNSLQPEWSKYVTLTRQNKILSDVEYDALYDDLLQFEPYVQASKAKRATKNHDPLALIAHSNAYLSQSHVQQIDESNLIVQHAPRTESNPGRANIQCYNCNTRGHYARDCTKPKVRDAKYFREQMLLAMKDEAGGTLNDEENDFMLDNACGDETLKELTAAVIMMTLIQPADDNAETEPKYDAEAVSEFSRPDCLQNGSINLNHHKLGKRPNKVYDPFLNAGLGYQNPERLKKAIAAQPKMYDGERLHSTKLIIDSPDSEKSLEDVEESRLKMKNKMI